MWDFRRAEQWTADLPTKMLEVAFRAVERQAGTKFRRIHLFVSIFICAPISCVIWFLYFMWYGLPYLAPNPLQNFYEWRRAEDVSWDLVHCSVQSRKSTIGIRFREFGIPLYERLWWKCNLIGNNDRMIPCRREQLVKENKATLYSLSRVVFANDV